MSELERRKAIQLRLSRTEIPPGPRALPALSTGFPGLDEALGVGGLPRGLLVEIFGPPSCGKTALALQIAASAQRAGDAAWIDAEHVFDASFASRLGVDVARLAVAQPATAEEALEMARRFTVSGAVSLVVIDSAAALIPELELQAGIGTAGVGLHGRVIGSELRRLSRVALRSDACVVILNQLRARMSGPGEVEVSSGGPSLKLHSALRISLAATGRRVRFRVIKNQLAAPYAGGELEWRDGEGFAEAR